MTIVDVENGTIEHIALYSNRPEPGFDWNLDKPRWWLVQVIINPHFTTDKLCNFWNTILLGWSFIFNINVIELLWFSKIPIHYLLVLLG